MAQQNQQTSIPAVPRTTRMFDDHGNLTRPWLVFFERVAAQEISLPGRIQPIGGEPFVLSIQEDGKTATLTVIYDPPARLGLFTGVTAHVEAPADSGKIVLSNDYGYNGNPKAPAGSEARRGSLQIKLPQPATENQIWRVYLTECSRGYKVPLVLYGNPNTSPWATIEVSKAAASAGVTEPPVPVAVSVAEKPNSRRLAQNEDGAWVTLFTLQVTVELKSDPLPNQWVAIELSRDDKEHWDGWTHDREITSKTQTFDIDIYVPASGNTFWARAWSRIPGYPGSAAEAVQSEAGAYIAGLAEPLPNAVTNASLSIRWRKTDQEIYAWGPAVQWTNPTPEQEPNFWTTMFRVGWVNANGEPKTEYGDPEFDYSAEVMNDEHPGKVVLHDGGQFWLFPAEDDPFPIARFTIWVRNRAGAAIKQLCWPGGADHFDVLLSDPATAPQDVEDFTVGTKKPDGSYDPVPSWDLLNEKLVFDWGCFLPADVSNLGAVGLFFKRPGGEWTPTFHDVSWIKPQPGVPYEDSFAVAGQDVPRQPEPWTFVACVADRRGAWKLNQDGTPAGPQITINTIAPNKGIEAGNINPAALDTPLAILNEKIAVVDKGIAERYLADQAVTARTMAEKAITAQNKALDALSVLNSNIDSVHIGKIINGTVIFNGDVFMARGYGYPLVQMSWNGIILWSGAETYGDSKAGTAQAVGLTSRPHVLIASNAIQLFSGSSGPSATLTSQAVTFWSDHGNTAQPYAQLSNAGLVVTSGDFVSTFSAARIRMQYQTNVEMTLDTEQLKIKNGTYSFEVKATGWTLWTVDQNENYPFLRASVVDGLRIKDASIEVANIDPEKGRVAIDRYGGLRCIKGDYLEFYTQIDPAAIYLSAPNTVQYPGLKTILIHVGAGENEIRFDLNQQTVVRLLAHNFMGRAITSFQIGYLNNGVVLSYVEGTGGSIVVNNRQVVDYDLNIGDRNHCRIRPRNAAVGLSAGELAVYYDSGLGKCVLRYFDGANTFSFYHDA